MESLPSILSRFPSSELSYENILHKKVSADLYMIIPKGVKSFAWLTYENDKNVCYILHLNKRHKICKAQKYCACFSNDLAYGTVFYGTFFEVNEQPYFTCENIFYYKGRRVDYYTYNNKLTIINKIFSKHLNQTAYTTDFIYFGCPIIYDSFELITKQWNNIPYPIYCIEFIRKNKSTILGKYFIKPDEIQQEAIFDVKALITADTYELYSQKGLIGLAAIPDFSTSVFMNQIFRNIKENNNLDLLEESDGEEEFENILLDKFVHLEKQARIKCVYMQRFQKWKPIEIVSNKESIS
jgi:hypothetical protein